MYISFYRSKNDLTCLCRRNGFFLSLNSRLKDGDCLFHGTSSLDDLRQEHLSGSKQITNFIHTIHQRAINNSNCPRILLQCFLQIFFQMFSDSFYQSVFQTISQRKCPPGFLLMMLGVSLCLHMQLLRISDQLFCSFRSAAQDNIFQ